MPIADSLEEKHEEKHEEKRGKARKRDRHLFDFYEKREKDRYN